MRLLFGSGPGLHLRGRPNTVSLEVERVFEVCWIAGGRPVPVQDYSWGTFTSTGQGPERTRCEPCVFVKCWVDLGVGGRSAGAGGAGDGFFR